jgi:hypothetical protein
MPYRAAIDIKELVSVENVMKTYSLGPNGALLFSMEYLEANFDWLEQRLAALPGGSYLVFDCPGQIELYTHHNSFKKIVERLTAPLRYRLTAVHLVDSHYCTDLSLYVAASLTSLTTMVQLELPHVNVLTKIDLLKLYGKLPFKLEFFTDLLDLPFLVEYLDESTRLPPKFKRLNAAMCELLSDFNLVGYLPLNIYDPQSFAAVINRVDKANGYLHLHAEALAHAEAGPGFSYDHASLVQDLFLHDEDDA